MVTLTLALLLQGEQPPVRGPSSRDELTFQIAKDLFNDGDYYGAAADFEGLLYAFPNSSYASQAKEMLFESCFQLMKAGHPVEVLGLEIPLIKSREKGLKMLRAALARYPSESFTPDFYMKLAEYFEEEREWDQAALEYGTIADLYPGQSYAARAVMGLARSSERQFKGTEYDAEPLMEAKRQYERVKFDYANHTHIADEAEAKLVQIDEVLAKKDYEVAEFYLERDLVGSARFMFEEVVTRFPKTDVARKAKERLDALADVGNPREDDE